VKKGKCVGPTPIKKLTGGKKRPKKKPQKQKKEKNNGEPWNHEGGGPARCPGTPPNEGAKHTKRDRKKPPWRQGNQRKALADFENKTK